MLTRFTEYEVSAYVANGDGKSYSATLTARERRPIACRSKAGGRSEQGLLMVITAVPGGRHRRSIILLCG